jgi:hypothetical protein
MLRRDAIGLLADYPAVHQDYVTHSGERVNGTVFVLLPRKYWRRILGGCCCRYCSSQPRKHGEPAYWDTAAITYDGRAHRHAWTVHAPELHGAMPKRMGG